MSSNRQEAMSTVAKGPAQREQLTSLHSWVLSQSVSSSRIVFAGDSAGCNLIYLTLLHLRDTQPRPSCVVAMSPWLDSTGTNTVGSEHLHTDSMFPFDLLVPLTNEASVETRGPRECHQ
jgi:acetyl esterase/lipase